MDKIISRGKFVKDVLPGLKAQGRKIVFTNGCFDVLHVGHTRYLKRARDCGDILIIGLNTDGSVQKLKGPERPLVSEDERAEVLACLEFVDYVIKFDEDTPALLIDSIVPDVLVKGGDYNADDVVGAKTVRDAGGCVEIIPFVEGRSSSGLIEKIKKL